MSKVFSEVDSRLRRCRKNEIGMPWEDRWSIEDFVDGFCDDDQVGRPKVEPIAADDDELVPLLGTGAPAEPFRPLTKAERKQLALELMDKILIKAHGDPAAFMEDGSSQLNKFLEWANKADAEDNSADMIDMTAQSFSRLAPIEQDRALLVVLTQYVPDDRRQDALERLGMSQADYDALHAATGRPRV